MIINRRVLLGFFGAFVVLLLIIVLASAANNRRTITVTTDVVPLKLELNDRVYTIKSPHQTISVPADIYNYRVHATSHGKPFVLVNKVNLIDNRKVQLRFNFAIYSVANVSKVLCGANKDASCLFPPATLAVTYLENYQWAVVDINSPTVGRGVAVLQVNNGNWHIEDGPGTDISLGGYYPQSVEEAILNAQK